jgi:ATP-dependent DNA helicase RecG
LRGRVGRSAQKSYCILFADQTTEDSTKRMQAMIKYASGFKIAEEATHRHRPERQHRDGVCRPAL